MENLNVAANTAARTILRKSDGAAPEAALASISEKLRAAQSLIDGALAELEEMREAHRPVGHGGMIAIRQAEHWETSELDFFVGLLRMAGRHVRVRYLRDPRNPDRIGARVEMKCWSSEYGWPYTVEACMWPDGHITAHGGNQIENKSTLEEAVDVFAWSAPYAQNA